MTLRKQAFSGVRWTAFSSLGRTILQVAQISILARLLLPADFGLIAIVTSIMAFLQIFADAGISNAIIHHQNISQKQLSSLYWLNVGISVSLAILLSTVSPFIAIWYGHPQLVLLLLVAGCTLIMAALAQQIRVVAQKELRFAELAKIELLTAGFGFVAAVAAAFSNAGVYSIIMGNFVAVTTGCIIYWYRLADGWRPQFCLSIKEIRPFLSFGAYMIGNNLANTFNSQIDIMLGGKILGSQAIGLYSMPRDLNLKIAAVINQIATNVGLPVMAKAQNNKDLLKQVYLRTMRMTASINFPIYVALALFAPEIVHTLLGAKWNDTIPMLRIFSVWGGLRSTGNPIGSLLMACGRADISFKWNVALLIGIPPIIWGSSHFGVLGVATSMASMMAALYWPNWYFQVRPLCGASFGEYSIQMIIPFIISISAGAISFLATQNISNEVLKLISAIILGIFTYILLSYYFNRVLVETLFKLIANKRSKLCI